MYCRVRNMKSCYGTGKLLSMRKARWVAKDNMKRVIIPRWRMPRAPHIFWHLQTATLTTKPPLQEPVLTLVPFLEGSMPVSPALLLELQFFL